MTSYIVTLKDDATEDQIKEAKKRAIAQGGKITQEYTIIKAFTVELPDDAITTLEADENVKAVEKDGKAHIC